MKINIATVIVALSVSVLSSYVIVSPPGQKTEGNAAQSTADIHAETTGDSNSFSQSHVDQILKNLAVLSSRMDRIESNVKKLDKATNLGNDLNNASSIIDNSAVANVGDAGKKPKSLEDDQIDSEESLRLAIVDVTFDSALSAESRDPDWADVAETQVQEAIGTFASDLPVEVSELYCQTTMCKLVMTIASAEDNFEVANGKLLNALPWETNMYSKMDKDENGNAVFINFIARENHKLPTI